ncbi:MAG TPA: tripartite tricarboxylate transporter substrate binding protein [Burkholderiales bacterium]|nr:tripartite tricarboxylate transporter substrate binding protein [Burkholderiales bacterium]
MHSKVLVAIMLVALGLGAAPAATAQTYPAKPVRLIVGFTPGTTVDILARLLGQKLTEQWGQQVVVENQPGASSTIGAASVARAPGDGYTLFFATTALILSPSMYRKLPYDVQKDFAPVTLVARVPNVLVVHPSLPVKDVKDLIALARSKPGQLNYASSGKGSASHLNTELFKTMAKLDIQEIPYKSSAQALTDVMTGEVLLNYPSLAAVLPHVKAGRVKPLAVSGAKRSQALPDVPAMAEFLPGYEASGWYGVAAPGTTPRELVMRLHADITKALRQDDLSQRMARSGAEVVGSTPEEFAQYMREGREKWDTLIRQLKIPVQG